MITPSSELRELGASTVIDIALRVLPESIKPISPMQCSAIRRVVEDGYTFVEHASSRVLDSGILALIRHGVLEMHVGSSPTCAGVGARLLEACRVELCRRVSAPRVESTLVVEYLAALDARRELATGRNPRGGKVLRGQARANAVRSAQHRLDAAEQALRKAVG